MDRDPRNDAPPSPRTVTLADLVPELVADVKAAADARASRRPRGPVTGLAGVDRIMGDYMAPGVHVVQAAPGAGKSAFCLQAAAHSFYPALFVSAEMGLLEVFRRTVARETQTFLGKLKSGEVGEREAQRLALATVEKLPHLTLMDATQAYASPTLIYDVAESLRDGSGEAHVLIVIDSLQVWSKSRRRADPDAAALDEYTALNYALEDAAGVAAKLSCPVMLISHRNRAGNRGAADALHAAKGSGDVEYLSETILDLTPKRDEEDASGEREVVALFVKNRHGAVGASVTLKFNGALQEFKE